MKEGFWIDCRSGKRWQAYEHCRFAKSPEGAAAMGLPEAVQQAIAPISCDYLRTDGNPGQTDREQVVIEVMKAGYIRMRGHGAQFSFEFWGNTRGSLWAILQFCQDMAGPYTWVVINNLKSNEQYASSFQDFEQRMKQDEDEVLRIASTLLKNPAQLGSAGG